METNPDATRVNDTPAESPTRPRCNITLPSWPDDRKCMLPSGHEGDHNDGRISWTTHRAMELHQCIVDGAQNIIVNADRLARESVLRGSVSMQMRGPENRAQRRATKRRGR